MKVSVIIPNYNHARYLQQRITSVLNQDFDDFEVLLLDDASTDDSRHILQQYAHHPKVSQVLLNETNSGSTFRQWDKGVSQAQGQWVWIAESDDWCEKDFLSTLMAGIQDNPKAVLAFAQSYVMTESNEVRGITKHSFLQETLDGPMYVKEVLCRGNTVYNASMAIFKRDAYEQISKKYKEFTFCGDWLFWIEVAQQGDVFISGRALNYFRKHSGDVSGSAYANGTFYTEYLIIVQHLQHTGLLSPAERTSLVLNMYHRFMHDAKLDKSRRSMVEKGLAEALQMSRLAIKQKWLQKFWKKNMALKAKRIYGGMLER